MEVTYKLYLLNGDDEWFEDMETDNVVRAIRQLDAYENEGVAACVHCVVQPKLVATTSHIPTHLIKLE